MSKTIDERVVEMRFDNKQFENNVQTSLSTLDKFKKSLNLSGAAKGLENIDKAAKKVDISGIGTAVDTVKMRFSALEVMGMTALANITNSAVNAGKRIASALTIEPVKSGFEEYETQINAVQTILANTESKGSTLKDVNNALDELNKYADMTIYNFTEMTRNIGTFTAAGVDLDTSVAAIKGIANLAAVSGSTSQQASTAMYQLSQALAAGTVKLQDWNSVVNAGMGGQVFQDALKETARVHCIAIDQMIEDEGSFRETLSKGWLTSEVLTETLSKFTGDLNEEQLRTMGYTEEQIASIIKMGQTANDAATKVKTFTQLFDTLKEAAQSGWTQSWELIVGDFEQAKESLTGLSDKFSEIINSSANARNELLEGALAPQSASLADWDKLYASGLASNKGFIELLKNAAREHGVAIDQMIEDEGSFRQTIKNGWLSNDILTEAFDNMSKGAQKSEEYVVQAGDTLSALAEKYGTTVEELAKTNGIEDVGLITVGQVLKISEALTGNIELTKEQKEAYDELSGSLDKVSGRDLLWQSLMNSIDAVIKVVSTLKQAWREVFPPATSDQLYGMIEALHSFSEKLILSDEASEKLKRTMKGLFSVAKIVADVLSAFLTAVGNVASGLSTRFGGSILDTAASIGDLLVSIKDWIESSGIIVETMDNISRGLLTGIDSIRAWAGEFLKVQSVQNGIAELGSVIGNTIDKISIYLKNGKDAISNLGIVNALQKIWNVLESVAKGIANTVGNLVGFISESFSKNGFENFFDIASAVAAGGIAVGITKFIKKLKEPFDGLDGILENVTGALGSVRESLEAYQTKLKAGSLLSIATAVGILAASLVAISLIEPDKLSSSIAAITMLFGELVGAFAVLEKINSGKGSIKNITVLIGMASAVAILAGAMKSLASLEWSGIAKGLVGIVGLCGILTAVSAQLSNSGKHVMKGMTQLVIFAAAIKILASACKDLSVLNWEELAKGLVGVGALLGEVALFLNAAKFQKRAMSSASGILIMSSALKVLASVCKDFGAMSWGSIGKGLVGIAGLFTELAVFVNLTGNAKHVLRTGISMIAIAASMKILASAISDFSSLNWEQIGRGLSAMGGALLEVAVAANFMPKNMIGIGTGLIAVGVSLKIVSDVLGKMGEMSWDAIAKGLTSLGGSMAELAIGLNLMKGTISGATALLVASAALAVLTPVLKALGSMSWESIAKGLVSLGGAFLVMGIAGAVLGPLVPAILCLSGAITLIGIGVAAAGIGMMAFGAGLTAVSAGFRALVESLADSGASVASGIAEIVKGLALGLVEFARVIKDGAPDLGEALIVLITEACKVISQCVPQITQTFFDLLVGALNGLSEYIPEIGNSLFDILIGILNTIAERIPELIQAGAGVISSIFEGILGLFGEVDGNGLVSTIVSIGEGLVGDIGEAIEGIISDVGEKIGSFVDGVGSTIGSFFGNIAGGFEAGVSEHLPEIGTNLSLFMTSASGFFDGVKGIDASALSGVSALAQAILEITAADLLDSITSFISGGSSLESFGESLTQFGTALVSYSNTVKDLDSDAVSKSADTGLLVASLADAVPKSGGVIQFFTGTSDLANFGESLACFGAGLSAYSNSVKDLDSDAVEKSVSAGLLVASLADAVPKSGGIVDFFTGKSDLSDFGSNLEAFGQSLSAYSKSIADVDADGITKTTTAANALVELNKAIPEDDGSGWFSDSFIGTFGSNLESFGSKFASFYLQVSTIDAGKLSSIVASMNTLVEFTKSTAGIDASGLSSFSDALSNLGTTGVQGFMEAISNSTADISGSAEGMMNALVSGVNSKGANLLSAFKTTIASSLTGIKSNFSAFMVAGQSLVTNIQNGAISKSAALISSFTSALSQMVSSIRGQYGGMYSGGVYLGQGLVSGINSMQSAAYSAGYELGAAAVRGEKDGQHSNSPSKDTIKAGGWLGEGLVIGMKKMTSRVYNSGRNLGESATESISSVFSRINDVINGDIDVQPTIRPILDLSDIQSGAGRLTMLLTGQQSVGVLANVNAISAGINNRSVKGNEDIISAIKGLRKDVNSRPTGNIYNVNGVTYDDGSNVSGAVESLIRAVKVERRV